MGGADTQLVMKDIDSKWIDELNNNMSSRHQDDQFNFAVRLFEEGKAQDGADVMFELAQAGHLDSIEQLTYLFLDQRDFEIVSELLDQASNQEDPLLQYLRARLAQEKESSNVAYPLFVKAALAGSPNACATMFEFAMYNHDSNLGKRWLDLTDESWDGYAQMKTRFEALEKGSSTIFSEHIDLQLIQRSVADLKKWLAKYGPMKEISEEDIGKFDEKEIWSEWTNDWIVELVSGVLNEYDRLFVSNRKRSEDMTFESVSTAFFLDCPYCILNETLLLEEECFYCDNKGLFINLELLLEDCSGRAIEEVIEMA